MSQPVSREAQGATLIDLERRCRRLFRYLALVAVLAALGAAAGMIAVVQLGRAQDNATAQFCDLRVRQRMILERQWRTTQQYLRSPVGQEHTGLNDYIRRFSVPQLRARLRDETVPPICKEH